MKRRLESIEANEKRMQRNLSAFGRRELVSFARAVSVSPRPQSQKLASLARATPTSNEASGARKKMGGDDGKTNADPTDNNNPDLLDSIRSFQGFVVDEVLSVNDLTKAAAVLGR